MDLNSLPSSGLIFGWLFDSNGKGSELATQGHDPLELSSDGYVWLHLNYANTQVQTWLKSNDQFPEDIVEILQEDVGRVRQKMFCRADGAHLIFFNDFQKEFNQRNSEEIVTLWIICIDNVLISLRPHPVEAPDVLKHSVALGKIKPQNIGDLYHHLLEIREDALHEQVNLLMDKMDQLEEIIIRGDTLPEHETLGRIRIQCNRMRRYFFPEGIAISHMIRNRPPWMTDDNFQEISEHSEKLSVLIQDLDHLYERAKVLQDEQSAHVAQFNANNLQVLSTMTVIFLPMTLITGIMGMNMGDLLGLESSFYEVIFLMILAGIFTFSYLKIKRIM
jgi:zinc transporter